MFISIPSFFYATFVLMHVFMRFKVTKWWAVLVVFIKITAFAVIVWLLDITTEFIILKNTIKFFQVLCGIVYIIFIIALFFAIEKLEKRRPPERPPETPRPPAPKKPPTPVKPQTPKTPQTTDKDSQCTEMEEMLPSQDDTKLSYAEARLTDSVGSDPACTARSQPAGTAGSEPEYTTIGPSQQALLHMDSK